MRLSELMETLTKPLNHGNPLVVLKVKYYNPHGEFRGKTNGKQD